MQKKTIGISMVMVGAAVILAALTYFRGSWTCDNGTWVRNGMPLSGMPKTACLKPETATLPAKAVCSPPWSCGRLAQGETGMKPSVWYLKYDDVDGPAKLEVAFVDGALCQVDGQPADCQMIFPPSGSDVRFVGVRDGDLFRVSWLAVTVKKS